LKGFPDVNPNAKKVDSSKGPFGEKPFEFIAGVGQVRIIHVVLNMSVFCRYTIEI